MNGKQGQVALTVVCLLFGVALMMQLRTESRLSQTSSSNSANNLDATAGALYDSNSALQAQVSQLLAARAASSNQASGLVRQHQLATQLDQLRAFNGQTPVSGPGVKVVINADLRPVDALDLLNEVRNAGAESIAINGQRVVYNTAIGGTQGHLTVNQVVVGSPLVIRATGAPDVLGRALQRPGGMLSYLTTAYPNARITVTSESALALPAYTGPAPVAAGP